MRRPRSYARAGVSLARADRFLAAIKPLLRKTRRPGQLGEIGGFGGIFDLRGAVASASGGLTTARGPARPRRDGLLLVSSTDGVGTKLAVARRVAAARGGRTTHPSWRVGPYEGLGVDLVAMNVNDVLCAGAEPWFFLDYIATGRIDPEVLVPIVRGVVRGCCEARCALIGGETAEMPLVYRRGEFDLAGFCVGAVPAPRLITGRAIRPGDQLIGLGSSGLHANGFTLVQRATSRAWQRRWARSLLAPTRIYVAPILALLQRASVHGLAHITGGSFREKLGRILPAGTAARLTRARWPVPTIFRQLQRAGGLSDAEMFRTFNMGLGMIVVVPPSAAAQACRVLASRRVAHWPVGEIIRGNRSVRIS